MSLQDCTIIRTMDIEHHRFNMGTGESTLVRIETVTRACGTPLFGAHERVTGVCRSCSQGWETTGSVFADEGEKAKALAAAEVQS